MKLLEDKINHELYFSIVQDEIIKATQIDEQIKKIIGRPCNDSNLSQLFELEIKLHKATTISVVFSALTAEAFINYYALCCGYSANELKNILKPKLTQQEKDQFGNSKYLSKTTKKWMRIPYEQKKTYLRQDLIQRLQELFTIRNKLVHYESYIPQEEDEKENFSNIRNELLGASSKETKYDKHFIQVSLEDAKKSKDTIIELVNELKLIDPSISNNWLTKSIV